VGSNSGRPRNGRACERNVTVRGGVSHRAGVSRHYCRDQKDDGYGETFAPNQGPRAPEKDERELERRRGVGREGGGQRLTINRKENGGGILGFLGVSGFIGGVNTKIGTDTRTARGKI